MRICTGLASAELAFFSRLGATSGATNRHGLFQFGCHGYRMQRRSAKRCSIVTSAIHFYGDAASVLELSVFDQTGKSRSEKVMAELFASETNYITFRPEIAPLHPRNPQQQSITGQAKG